jgi:cell division protein ZapA
MGSSAKSSTESGARKARPEATEIEIFGAVYRVRSEDDDAHMQELAGLVDRKMREIAGQVTTVDTAKIAVMTALNLADELFQCRKGQEKERKELGEKVTAITGRLASALSG